MNGFCQAVETLEASQTQPPAASKLTNTKRFPPPFHVGPNKLNLNIIIYILIQTVIKKYARLHAHNRDRILVQPAGHLIVFHNYVLLLCLHFPYNVVLQFLGWTVDCRMFVRHFAISANLMLIFLAQPFASTIPLGNCGARMLMKMYLCNIKCHNIRSQICILLCHASIAYFPLCAQTSGHSDYALYRHTVLALDSCLQNLATANSRFALILSQICRLQVCNVNLDIDTVPAWEIHSLSVNGSVSCSDKTWTDTCRESVSLKLIDQSKLCLFYPGCGFHHFQTKHRRVCANCSPVTLAVVLGSMLSKVTSSFSCNAGH